MGIAPLLSTCGETPNIAQTNRRTDGGKDKTRRLEKLSRFVGALGVDAPIAVNLECDVGTRMVGARITRRGGWALLCPEIVNGSPTRVKEPYAPGVSGTRHAYKDYLKAYSGQGDLGMRKLEGKATPNHPKTVLTSHNVETRRTWQIQRGF